MTKRFAVIAAGSALTVALAAGATIALAVGLAVGGNALLTAERATAAAGQAPLVRVVEGSTYFEEELNSDVTWRLLSNGRLEYRMPRPLLREGEDPDQWFEKAEFKDRMRLAAESRRRGDRPADASRNAGAAATHRTKDFIVP